jgi:hypothetical protein
MPIDRASQSLRLLSLEQVCRDRKEPESANYDQDGGVLVSE